MELLEVCSDKLLQAVGLVFCCGVQLLMFPKAATPWSGRLRWHALPVKRQGLAPNSAS